MGMGEDDFLKRLTVCGKGYADDGIPVAEYIDASLRPIVAYIVNALCDRPDVPVWLDASMHTVTVLTSWARNYRVFEKWPVDAPLLGGSIGQGLSVLPDGKTMDASELLNEMASRAEGFLSNTALPEAFKMQLVDVLCSIGLAIYEGYFS